MSDLNYVNRPALEREARQRRFFRTLPLCFGLSLAGALGVALTLSIPFAVIEFLLCMTVLSVLTWVLSSKGNKE